MIRFCDSDVGCVEYGLLNRSELLSYFLSGNREEIICVYDGKESEEFVGIITYYSLLYALSIDGAIIKDYVILDQNIWRNARELFRKKRCNVRDTLPLPVLNKDYQLICFAYQDEDANREIRMLRELNEMQGALQFTDVFPEYRCVKIHGFNELAFFFAEYLRNQDIFVQLDGTMWQGFFPCEECEIPEYECLDIYAEGTWEKSRNWKENLLRSVSVEFECVDKIYEANIKDNRIGNVNGEIEVLLERLRNEIEVILCGTDMAAQDTYDFLIGNGIEASGFVVKELSIGQMHRLFGKRILGFHEAICVYHNPVFIDCHSKHSAWGMGDVDYYDYLGYKRDERYILLRDYIEVPGNNLLNALRGSDVILTGDQYLCVKLYGYLLRKNISVLGYLCTLPEDIQPENVPEVLLDVIDKEAINLIVEPIYRSEARDKFLGMEERDQRKRYLRDKNIDNYTEYFCDTFPFVRIEQENDLKYQKSLQPKRIVLGSILYFSGNIFFRSLLDWHPLILEMHYCDLNHMLFWICMRLSTERVTNILPMFWRMIEGDERCIIDRGAFIEKMEELLACKSSYTSQELFVMFHIAYAYMYRKDIAEQDIRNMMIYWEPHNVERSRLEDMVKWLGNEEVRCDIINVVRDSIPQKAGELKQSARIKTGVRGAYFYGVLWHLSIEKKNYEQNKRLVIKFEDLKCNPKEILEKICSSWEIAWSDTLLQTTQHGEEWMYYDGQQNVTGFDLKPVYNKYENFFSELDRLKLMVLDAPWRKKYGYPYVDLEQFTRRELQEMLLKEFRFEKPGDITGFYKDRLDLNDRIVLQIDLRKRLQETRCLLSVWEDMEKA